MILSLDQMQQLAAECAPAVSAETLLSVAKVESGFDPLAIQVNGEPRISAGAINAEEAAEQASALMAQGRSVDLGVLQINSRNLARLGMTVEDAFDPCKNIAAAGQLLSENYARSDAMAVGEQEALRVALSYYNTGRPERGFRNGYVAKVIRAARQIVPAIAPDQPADPVSRVGPTAAPAPSWDVFGSDAKPGGFVMDVAADPSTETASDFEQH